MAFLGSVKSEASVLKFPPHQESTLNTADLPTVKSSLLDTLNQRRALLILLRPHISQTRLGGAGISTCYPSPTPFGLGLGPD